MTKIVGFLHNRSWLFGLLLIAAIILVYQPVWHAGFIWDDEGHVTTPGLRSLNGLARIWTQLGATQQYYPLVHSVFWVEHRLWGDSTAGYHLINILLHALSALLLVKILRQLKIPGAWLAAAIFALHPVQVESVAWISELKNTLSGAFYLGSALAYLGFDQNRNRGNYALALGLFVLGLMSKTVIATLPAALLVIFWWQRGKLAWKQDVLPLIPFFVAGIAAGLFTAWVERTFVGATGAKFNFSIIERFLIAGRAIWFYLGKLFWPANLSFVYPRWQVSSAAWWQYLYPGAAVLLLGALCWQWRRWRGPLAGLLFFGGTLFPVLGFLNVYPFRYSFVADHFQYLAGIGPITLVAAGIATALGVSGKPFLKLILYGALLLTLGLLTRQQAGRYADVETLWRTTIAQNPDAYLAHENLGALLLEKGRVQEAITQLQKAMEIQPDAIEVHNDIGIALMQSGQTDKGMAQFRKALEIDPNYIKTYINLGNALVAQGRFNEAIGWYQKVIEINSDYAKAHYNLGIAFAAQHRTDEAIVEYQRAIGLEPDNAEAHYLLGVTLELQGKLAESAGQYRKAIAIKPDYAEAHYNLGVALGLEGKLDEVAEQYRKAIAIKPDYIDAHGNLAKLLATQGRLDEAVKEYQRTLELAPNSDQAHFRYGQALQAQHHFAAARTEYQKALDLNPQNLPVCINLAWLLATCPDSSLRNGQRAVTLAQQAEKLGGIESPQLLDTLAAAYAEAGRFDQAVETAQRALNLPATSNDRPLAEAIQSRLKLYEANVPFHEKP